MEMWVSSSTGTLLYLTTVATHLEDIIIPDNCSYSPRGHYYT